MNWRLKATALLLPAACQLGLLGCVEQPQMINIERLSELNRLAVLPFEDSPGMHGRNSGNAVAGFVTGELLKHKRYRIIERSKIKSVLDEQDLQISDLIDPETAVKIGKMLGVDGVILGSVSEYEMDKTQVYIHMIPIITKEYKVGATLRMIDVTNGEIVYAHSACGKSGNSFTEAGRLSARQLLGPLPK